MAKQVFGKRMIHEKSKITYTAFFVHPDHTHIKNALAAQSDAYGVGVIQKATSHVTKFMTGSIEYSNPSRNAHTI